MRDHTYFYLYVKHFDMKVDLLFNEQRVSPRLVPLQAVQDFLRSVCYFSNRHNLQFCSTVIQFEQQMTGPGFVETTAKDEPAMPEGC